MIGSHLNRVVLVCLSCALAASSSAANTQLVIQIRPEAVLAWQADNTLLVKARLAPGTQARVWADDVCGGAPAGARVIPASGTYSIPLAMIGESGEANVCLSSTDASLNTYLPAPRNTQ